MSSIQRVLSAKRRHRILFELKKAQDTCSQTQLEPTATISTSRTFQNKS